MAHDIYARAVAAADADDQAAWLNAFIDELTAVCPNHDPAAQLWHVAKDLNAATVKAFQDMCDSAKYQRDTAMLELAEVRAEIQLARTELDRLSRDVESKPEDGQI